MLLHRLFSLNLHSYYWTGGTIIGQAITRMIKNMVSGARQSPDSGFVTSVSSVQFSSVTQSCLTLCNPMNRSTPGLPVHHQLPESPKPLSIESVMPSSHLILCHPLHLLPPILPSIKVFSSELALRMRWPKYWSFSYSISPSNEHPGLISFRMDWLDLLAVQGTLKSLFQHHSSKHQNLWCSAFFTVQLWHPYMTTGKTIALTRWTFVGKEMSLLLNMLFTCLQIFSHVPLLQ